MRVAITGATGFLGEHLVRACAPSHDVVAVARDPARAASLGVPVAQAELGDVDALTAALRGCDALVANAALSPGRRRTAPEAFHRVNVVGAANQLEAARRAGVRRVIWISTVAVYRTRLARIIDEHGELLDPDRRQLDFNQLTTQAAYSRTKAAAERLAWSLAEAHGLELTVLRPGPIVGAGDPKLTARYLAKLRAHVALAPTARVPHVDAADVAAVAVTALARAVAVGRAYNVTGASVSPLSILRAMRAATGARVRLVPVWAPFAVRFDDQRARDELDFTPVDVPSRLAALATGT